MTPADLDALAADLTRAATNGMGELALLTLFCTRCGAAGLPLDRAILVVDTLHPIYEGRAFRWRSDGADEAAVVEYGRTDEGGAAAEDWQGSVFFRMWNGGEAELRRCFRTGDAPDFKHMRELAEEGHTDYVAFVQRFEADEGVIGDLDCIFSYFVTRHPEGFSEAGLAALRRLLATLALAIKCASLARIASTLVEVYLGRDAGERVLKGRIARGVADRIRAVLWYSDLRGFTGITDTADPAEIIPLLNDYSGAVIEAVHAAGGDVLKLIGDGVLAIFTAPDASEACRAALAAEAGLRGRLEALRARRLLESRPVTSVYLGLHIGEVFYGNIGSEERLDFTVVGPTVNEAARIASMCRSVDRAVVASSEFRAACPLEAREALVSVGRYALRGVGRAQELFTLDPALLQETDDGTQAMLRDSGSSP